MALGFAASRRRSPRRWRLASWACTLELEVNPTASPISRTVGGYPRSSTVRLMKSTIRCCRAVILSMPATVAPLLEKSKHVFDKMLDGRTYVRQNGSPMTRTRVRWGRVGATVAAVAVGIGLLAGSAGAGSRAADPAPTPQHVVRSGETVWTIAQRLVGPHGDPRPVVDAIIARNGIRNASIHPGQVLAVPIPG